MSPPHESPSQSSPSMIAETAAGVDRVRSVSSMRSRKMPPWCRAKSQLKSAVRAPPMCRKPVGEGAKRTVTVIPGGWGAAEPISTIGQPVVAKHLAQAGLHQLPCRGVGKLVDDHHVVRQHPARKLLAEEPDQFATVRPPAWPRRHDQQRPLAPARMGYRDHCGLGDIVMRDSRVL